MPFRKRRASQDAKFVEIESEAKSVKAQQRKPLRKAPTDWDAPGDISQSGRLAKFNRKIDWEPLDSEDRLKIDDDIVSAIEAEGYKLQWLTESVLGSAQPAQVALNQAIRNGWQRLQPGDIDGIDNTEIEGLGLYIRPLSIHRKAEAYERQKARDVVNTKSAGLIDGNIPGVTLDARHPSARRTNRINKTIEPIAIPGDE